MANAELSNNDYKCQWTIGGDIGSTPDLPGTFAYLPTILDDQNLLTPIAVKVKAMTKDGK